MQHFLRKFKDFKWLRLLNWKPTFCQEKAIGLIMFSVHRFLPYNQLAHLIMKDDNLTWSLKISSNLQGKPEYAYIQQAFICFKTNSFTLEGVIYKVISRIIWRFRYR